MSSNGILVKSYSLHFKSSLLSSSFDMSLFSLVKRRNVPCSDFCGDFISSAFKYIIALYSVCGIMQSFLLHSNSYRTSNRRLTYLMEILTSATPTTNIKYSSWIAIHIVARVSHWLLSFIVIVIEPTIACLHTLTNRSLYFVYPLGARRLQL